MVCGHTLCTGFPHTTYNASVWIIVDGDSCGELKHKYILMCAHAMPARYMPQTMIFSIDTRELFVTRTVHVAIHTWPFFWFATWRHVNGGAEWYSCIRMH